MKRSPFLETQRRLFGDGLVLAPAVGGEWELPAQYQSHGWRAEYDAAHQAGGLVDRSWRAVLQLTGTDRQAFLQGMVSNDVAALAPGQSCRAAFLDTTGHILADLQVHALPDALMVETDPRCLPTLAEMLDKFLIMEDVEITDVSDQWTILSMWGISSFPTLPDDAEGFIAGRDLWLPAADAPAVWERLVIDGYIPIGEEAAEILRVEAGDPAWGHELNASVLLPEADLPDAVSYTKGCYVGQEIIARMRARGHANRALRGVLFGPGAPIPPSGSTLHVREDDPEPGRQIGRITSAVASPLFGGRPLALAYVRKEYFENNTPIDVQIAQPDGTVFSFAGTVLTRPFV